MSESQARYIQYFTIAIHRKKICDQKLYNHLRIAKLCASKMLV